MAKMNWLDWVAVVLIIVGALNWGLVALQWNLVDFLLGAGSVAARVVYGLVGLAGVYSIYSLSKVGK